MFYELQKPELNPAFGWFVFTAKKDDQKKLLFLATDGTVKVRTGTTGFFFKSEMAAHIAAVAYYNANGMFYPHIGEYAACEKAGALKASGTVLNGGERLSTIIQSEVMEF